MGQALITSIPESQIVDNLIFPSDYTFAQVDGVRRQESGVCGQIVRKLVANDETPDRIGAISAEKAYLPPQAYVMREESSIGVRIENYTRTGMWGQTGRSLVFLSAQWREETEYIPSVPTFPVQVPPV